jgi:hypothetical protein
MTATLFFAVTRVMKVCKITMRVAFTDHHTFSHGRLNGKLGEENCKNEKHRSDRNHSFQSGIDRIVAAVVATAQPRRGDNIIAQRNALGRPEEHPKP